MDSPLTPFFYVVKRRLTNVAAAQVAAEAVVAWKGWVPTKAATAHARGCPVAPCPMDSPLTPFFCVVKRRLTNVEAAQVASEAVVAWKGWLPTKNWMLRRVKGVVTVSVPLAQY